MGFRSTSQATLLDVGHVLVRIQGLGGHLHPLRAWNTPAVENSWTVPCLVTKAEGKGSVGTSCSFLFFYIDLVPGTRNPAPRAISPLDIKPPPALCGVEGRTAPRRSGTGQGAGAWPWLAMFYCWCRLGPVVLGSEAWVGQWMSGL